MQKIQTLLNSWKKHYTKFSMKFIVYIFRENIGKYVMQTIFINLIYQFLNLEMEKLWLLSQKFLDVKVHSIRMLPEREERGKRHKIFCSLVDGCGRGSFLLMAPSNAIKTIRTMSKYKKQKHKTAKKRKVSHFIGSYLSIQIHFFLIRRHLFK